MTRRAKLAAGLGVLLVNLCGIAASNADSYVETNSNVVGRTAPGFYRGIPAMQDNEASCAINPILPRNIVCAWNASGGSDDAIGDTWLRFSESLDGGQRFYNRYLNGSNLEPATSIGQQFAADPVMMCWPGGCGTVMLASTRGESGGVGGGIYIQWMADLNTEAGFRKAFKVSLDQVYRSTGSKFADKPHAVYMLDEKDPGTIPVSLEVEMPDGSTQNITREWPKARILVVFALFNPSKNDIEILSTYTDDYGVNWSNPKQIAQTSGRDQGVSVAAIGDTVFIGFRRFANQGDTDDIMGVVATDGGTRVGKPFVIAESVCVYDVPTLPATTNSSAAAARTNDFPWVGQDGSRFIMVYSERRHGPEGCMANPDMPSDPRIVAVVGSGDGTDWSTDPIEIDPNPNHGFQFMPVVDCSLGVCQVAWWDSRRDSLRTRQFLEAQNNAGADAALVAFENLSILADFHFPLGIEPYPNLGYQFRRTADMYTRKIRLLDKSIEPLGESTRASRYRLGLYPTADGVKLVERENNPFNIKAYKSNTVPFMSDYSSMTSVKHRYVFDPSNLAKPPFWESNAGPNPLSATDQPVFWLSWTDARNMRGAIYTYGINGQLPYARTPFPEVPQPETVGSTTDDDDATETTEESLTAEAVEDFNPTPEVCTAAPLQSGGTQFVALNNRVKDSDIYGALIENRVTGWALNPTKTLGQIQRTYVIVVENETDFGKVFRLEIANQPTGFDADPKTARASWLQLPFDPNSDDFQSIEPTVNTLEAVGPLSSGSVAFFLVSGESANPVNINIYDVTGIQDPDDPATPGELVNTVTIIGAIEAGPLLNADGNLNLLENHDPFLYAPEYDNPDHYNSGHYTFDQGNPDLFNPDQYNPDLFNPDLFNPDLFNPDQFNPDLFNPDLFNPDLFNPDQYNPDLFNPDLFNPDLFNPDLFNPDLFNPDQFNPDLFNVALTSSDDLQNSEIPNPDLTNVVRDPGGLVSKIDVNFGLQNEGNTLTPYTVDFAIADPEVLAYISEGKIATQLIVWQNKQVEDVQYCNPRLLTENRVIAVENNPDLSRLEIPSILNNRIGALTYFVTPGDVLQNTLRFIGPIDLIRFVEQRLRDNVVSYVFTAQAANTGESALRDEFEQIINDRTPASFNFQSGVQNIEADAPGGASLPADYVTATKDDEVIAVFCNPSLPTVIPLNNGNGGTNLSCSASTDNGVTATVDLVINVYDTEPPIIDLATLPADIVTQAASPDGSVVDFDYPQATDVFGVDPNVTVTCSPASGSLFPFQAPGPQTTVSCIATDASGNASDPTGPPPAEPATFTVTLQDTQSPVIGPITVFNPPAPPPEYELSANSSTFLLTWGPFNVNDADSAPTVQCTVDDLGTLATPDPNYDPPQYKFSYNFPVGETTVTCTATDDNGLFSTVSFPVFIYDKIAPVVTLIGDAAITIDGSLDPYVDPGATAIDNNDPTVPVTINIDSSDVDRTTAGVYTVKITATDPYGNTSEPPVLREVTVELSLEGTGIIPTKTDVKVGSSNPLLWAWLDLYGNPVDTSGEIQYLRIENCDTGALVIDPAGYPGASGFRFKSDNYWQFNWDSEAPEDAFYCAYVRLGESGPEMASPRIYVR
jgi:hypothetical protein